MTTAIRRFGSGLGNLRSREINGPLCANMTETSCVTAISEQGGKEKTQNGIDKRHRQTRDERRRNHRFGFR